MHWNITRPMFCLMLPTLLLLGGCEDRDPYRRTDVWQPTGANAGNIAAQVADPRDLIRGRSTSTADGHAATSAIEHLWAGQPHTMTPIGSMGSSGSSGAGASGSGGS